MRKARLAARQFGRNAETYAVSESRRYPPDVVLGLCAPREDDVCLDVGTGPGTLVTIVGPHVRRCFATDVTPEMLAIYLVRTAGAPPSLADAHRLPFADASFTLVTCGSVLHHLEDPALAIREIARVLRPGGRALLVDMAAPENERRRAARDYVERARDPSHVRTLAPSDIHSMSEAAGLSIEEEVRHAEDKRDDEWAALARADLASVRQALDATKQLAGGFLALRWEGDAYVFRRERGYYLAVKR